MSEVFEKAEASY